MADVIKLHPCNDPDTVLQDAVGCYDHVLVIGILSDDHSIDCRGTTSSKADIVFWLEHFKHKLLAGDYDA